MKVVGLLYYYCVSLFGSFFSFGLYYYVVSIKTGWTECVHVKEALLGYDVDSGPKC